MANFCLITVLALCVALAYAGYAEELMKRNAAFGTMRFGKRSMLESEDEGEGLARLTRSGASLGTMRFGKRAALGTMRFGKRAVAGVAEYEPEDLEMFSGAKRSAALGTMRFGRR